MLPEFVVIWICPLCGEYYASSNAGDLQAKFNTDIKGDKTFTRARCPTLSCASQGVIRVPIKIQVPQNIGDGQLSVSATAEEGSPKWFGARCERCAKPQVITGDTVVCTGCGRVTNEQRV